MTKILLISIGAVGLAFLVSILLAFPVMLLWNWLVTDIFGLRAISAVESLGLLILSAILFKTSMSSTK